MSEAKIPDPLGRKASVTENPITIPVGPKLVTSKSEVAPVRITPFTSNWKPCISTSDSYKISIDETVTLAKVNITSPF